MGGKEQFLEGIEEARWHKSFPPKRMPHFIMRIQMRGRTVKKRKRNVAPSLPPTAIVQLVLSYKHQEAFESLLNISSSTLYLSPPNTAGHSCWSVPLVCPDNSTSSVSDALHSAQKCTWDIGQQCTPAQKYLEPTMSGLSKERVQSRPEGWRNIKTIM